MNVSGARTSEDGVCSHDAHLRCSLLALWQWIWGKAWCIAVLRVQSWRPHEGAQWYKELGADQVMKITDEEKEAANAEETACTDLHNIVSRELDRQRWRGEMAMKAYEYYKKDEQGVVKDPTGAIAQGLGHPLPTIQKDQAWKLGGWCASSMQQRRSKGLDGGTAVTKIRMTVKNSGGD